MKKFPLYARENYEDVELHVQEFAHYWKVVKPTDPIIIETNMNELKKDVFINTFKKKAREWYSRYKPEHFNTHNEVVVAFLQRFRLEKIKLPIV